MIENINNIIRNWLLEAADICRTFPREALDVSEKSPGHKVTALDFEIDAYLKKNFRDTFPGHHIISEEGDDVGDGDSPYTWLLDPIDGTSYLIQGLKAYSVVVMLFKNDSPLAVGVINPETNTYWIATHDCFESHIPNVNRLTYKDQWLVSPNFKGRGAHANHHLLPIGSIAYRACLGVSCDSFAVLSLQNLSSWDVLPATFIAQLKGFCVRDLDGNPLVCSLKDTKAKSRGLIITKTNELESILKWIHV